MCVFFVVLLCVLFIWDLVVSSWGWRVRCCRSLLVCVVMGDVILIRKLGGVVGLSVGRGRRMRGGEEVGLVGFLGCFFVFVLFGLGDVVVGVV